MSLIDVQIRKAKASSKQYKLFDRDGLYILVKPTGVKIWRYKYHYAGIERLLSFGKYPEVSLVKARVFQFEARKLLVEGIDPGQKNLLAFGKIFLNMGKFSLRLISTRNSSRFQKLQKTRHRELLTFLLPEAFFAY